MPGSNTVTNAAPGFAALDPGYSRSAMPGQNVNAATHGLISHGESEETRG
jgi:hypothetical protein